MTQCTKVKSTKLRQLCKRINYKFTLKNLLTSPNLKIKVEEFLRDNFCLEHGNNGRINEKKNIQ